MPSDDKSLVIGRITGSYGVKGWVKVHAYTDPLENFFRFKRYTLRRKGESVPIEFDDGRRHGKGLIAHIAGVDDRAKADGYRGLDVSAPATDLPELSPGEYYWSQLEGLEVWCRDAADTEASEAALLGRVDYLIETGANDVLVVAASEDSIDDRERLIPYLPGDVVTGVDLEAGTLEVSWFLED
ncbi:MAG: ribosome maturation factor RimM [Pseudomonadota bacterium]